MKFKKILILLFILVLSSSIFVSAKDFRINNGLEDIFRVESGGNILINGNLTVIGDLLNTTVTEQNINGSFNPSFDDLFSVGSNFSRWKNVYATTFYGDLGCGNITGAVSDLCTINSTTTGGTQIIEVNVTPTSGYVNHTTIQLNHNINRFFINATTNTTTFRFEAEESTSGTKIDTDRIEHTDYWNIIKDYSISYDNITLYIKNASVDEQFNIQVIYE